MQFRFKYSQSLLGVLFIHLDNFLQNVLLVSDFTRIEAFRLTNVLTNKTPRHYRWDLREEYYVRSPNLNHLSTLEFFVKTILLNTQKTIPCKFVTGGKKIIYFNFPPDRKFSPIFIILKLYQPCVYIFCVHIPL